MEKNTKKVFTNYRDYASGVLREAIEYLESIKEQVEKDNAKNYINEPLTIIVEIIDEDGCLEKVKLTTK